MQQNYFQNSKFCLGDGKWFTSPDPGSFGPTYRLLYTKETPTILILFFHKTLWYHDLEMYCMLFLFSNYFLLHRHGEEWQRVRQAVAPILMRPKAVEENIDNFIEVTKDAVEQLVKLKETSGLGGEIPDLEGELSRWAAESKFTCL